MCAETVPPDDPSIGHRRGKRFPGHAWSHSQRPDDGIYRPSGQMLLTKAVAALRRRDPTNPAPARPPSAGGAGAGGVPHDWRRGTRSRDTVRLPVLWSFFARRLRIESSVLTPLPP